MRWVALVPSLFLIAGTATALVAGDGVTSRAALAVAVIGLAAALVAWWRRRADLLVPLVAVVFAAGGAALGRSAVVNARDPPLRRAWQERLAQADTTGSSETARRDDTVFAVITGVLRADAVVGSDQVSLSLSVRRVAFDRGSAEDPRRPDALSTLSVHDEIHAPGGVLLAVSGAPDPEVVETWRAGRTIRVPARLRRPSRHLDPGVRDEEEDLARRGTTLVGSVKSALLVELVSRGGCWSETAGRIRAYTRRVIAAHIGPISSTAAALVTAILIGDRAGLDPDVARALQEAGTYHVVAISGGNVAVLAVLTLTAFRWAGILGRAAMVVAVIGFLAFGAVVEGGASVDRAVTMAVLSFVARAADHRVDARHAVIVAAAVLVVVSPLVVVDPGFLLSFAATAGIVGAVPLFASLGYSRSAAVVAGVLVASTAAELASLPIVARLFGRVTLAGLLLNVLAVPLMSATQLAGLAVLLSAPVSGVLADLAAWVAALLAHGLVESAGLVEWAPIVSWRVAAPSAVAIVAYYVGWMVAYWGWWLRRTHGSARRASWVVGLRGGVTLGALALCWIVLEPWTWPIARGDGRLQVVFLDVGQGDAALIRFPRGHTMLVDAGGSRSRLYDVGERVVGPAARTVGVRRLDTVVVTHADVDHAGGIAAVLRDFRPFELWEGVPVPLLPLRQQIRAEAARRAIRWVNVQRHDLLSIDDVEVTVRHPVPPDWERQTTRNDDSIVLELRWRDVSIVLAGDIAKATEAEIGALFDGSVPIRVVKVPHHGSLTSSTPAFLEALRPAMAVFSAGRGNPFGHPAPGVLDRYVRAGVAIFRTDEDGAVSLSTDGSRVDVRTFAGREAVVTRRIQSARQPS